MKTKTMKTIQGLMLLLCLVTISISLISCGGDDEEENMMQVASEPSLSLTVAGTTYVGDFTGFNAAIIAATNPNITWTSVTLGGSTTTGETISFVIAFQGKQAGTSTVTGPVGEDTNSPEGLSLALVIDNDGEIEAVGYEAVNVTINISSYNDISGITAEVAGTFSGTVVDDNGVQSNISGSFNTGSLE